MDFFFNSLRNKGKGENILSMFWKLGKKPYHALRKIHRED